MVYTLLSVVVAALGLLLAYWALRLLVRGRWLRGFIRGLFGVALLLMALVFALVALDLSSYHQLQSEEPVATLSFRQGGPQAFEATLVRPDGREQAFELRGDQWQLDARIIRWQRPLTGFIRPGYRLDRLSGRYYSLEDERRAERTLYNLDQSDWGADLWRWINRSPEWFPAVEARYGSATFVPMADNALFEVRLSGSGLTAYPLNEPARQAVSVWE